MLRILFRSLLPSCLPLLLLLLLLIQPGSVTLGMIQEPLTKQPIADTYVLSGLPNQNQATAERLLVGYDQTGGDQIQRALLKFAISSDEIPVGSVVESAKLWLYLSALTPNDAPMTVKVSRIASDWQEDVTWTQHLSLPIIEDSSVTTFVPIQGGWYQWEIRALLQTWINNSDRDQHLSLLIRGNESAGQHERGFWSKDCPDSKCGAPPGNRPKLEIQFAKPTPTPTPAHTPIPQPAVAIMLQANTKHRVEVGEQIIYTIFYQNNGVAAVESVQIANQVPKDLEIVTINNGGKDVGGSVNWNLGNLNANQSGSVSYVGTRIQGEETITNEYATVQWNYQATPKVGKSNTIFNPSFDNYLPLIER